jgi:5-methylcytosine-specific restriction endonuclease McrA
VNQRDRARRQRQFTKGFDKKGICIDCGKVRVLVADHQHPVTLGGSWDPANRRGRCAKCHGKKTYREKVSPFEFLE